MFRFVTSLVTTIFTSNLHHSRQYSLKTMFEKNAVKLITVFAPYLSLEFYV